MAGNEEVEVRTPDFIKAKNKFFEFMSMTYFLTREDFTYGRIVVVLMTL